MGYDEPGRSGQPEPTSAVPAVGVDAVVDDPDNNGEPGRDRFGVYVVWETLLLLGFAALVYLLWQEDPAALRGAGLRALIVAVVGIGLLALAAGLSLRTAAANLAIGPVAVAAGLHFAEQGDRGLLVGVGTAAAVAALGGLLLGLLVVVLHVPGWAASLGGAAGVIVYIEQRSAPVLVQADYDPRSSAGQLFVGFAAIAVFGGLFGAVGPVRRLVGRFRPVADPARRRGAAAAVVVTGGYVCSTVLAMLAGALIASADGAVTPSAGLDWTLLAVGAALLAGTSAFGLRGGVFGTLLTAGAIGLFLAYAQARGWTVSRWAVGGAVLVAGLLVTRLVETYGRPAPAATVLPAPPSPPVDATNGGGWTVARPEPVGDWPPVLPAQPTGSPADPWGTRRWETGPRTWEDAEDR
ncbi:ABC transporter permease [Micromonospora craterilacus]|uniref:ABC transporter permease n=1 Tax=Micromonospora craterilacus TaxID=1655439 RepID=A0A2W2EYT4_9ACTN|nr:ABC transporter permease [Micromonospora craterilacus]PZG22059.1 ABC transporter permease [Micromonospora craterilacus]